ncbi:MAG: cell division protein FtsA [Hyphomonadaceae bacterium]|nr:cell division protein FtsA [Hyphomonadaceae bacterium]
MLTRSAAAKQINAIGVLDIGTSKTACIIVSAPERKGGGAWRREGVRILGFGCKPSRGLKAGVVIDHDGAEQAARSAVMQAEQMAGVTVDDIILAVTCGRLKSRTFAADTRIEGNPVDSTHIERLLTAGRRYAERDGGTLLHLNHLGYQLDDSTRTSNPLGMTGATLAANLHAITVDDAPLRSLLNVVERAGFNAVGAAPAPYASGLGSTNEEERRAGAVCIDMGAGATTLSIFSAGRLHTVDTVAVGGQHVTFDIARALSTPFDQAERIKTLYGTLAGAASEDQEMVAYTLVGEEEPSLHQTPKARIHGIVSNRVTDLLSHIAERIERSGAGHLAAHSVVLTGGGSLLPGLSTFAERILARPVRIAQLQPAAGLSPEWCTPVFSTAVGLAQIAFDPGAGIRRATGPAIVEGPSYLERVGQWLRKGF